MQCSRYTVANDFPGTLRCEKIFQPQLATGPHLQCRDLAKHLHGLGVVGALVQGVVQLVDQFERLTVAVALGGLVSSAFRLSYR